MAFTRAYYIRQPLQYITTVCYHIAATLPHYIGLRRYTLRYTTPRRAASHINIIIATRISGHYSILTPLPFHSRHDTTFIGFISPQQAIIRQHVIRHIHWRHTLPPRCIAAISLNNTLLRAAIYEAYALEYVVTLTTCHCLAAT